MILEGLHLPFFAADHLLDVDRHLEATGDLREAISILTDHGLCRDHDHPGNTEVHTEADQGHTRLDPDPHQGDAEAEDETALDGMAREGEVQATAVIAAMTIEAEVEVAEEEAEDGVDNVEIFSRKMALGLKGLRSYTWDIKVTISFDWRPNQARLRMIAV